PFGRSGNLPHRHKCQRRMSLPQGFHSGQSGRERAEGLAEWGPPTSIPPGGTMAAESSFDVVSKVDRQEVDNAVNQAAKEVRQRFDFKNTDASIAWAGEAIEMSATTEDRVRAVLDVFQ